MLPTISFTPDEHARSSIHQDVLQQAAKLFRLHGCLMLENVFPAKSITRLRNTYLKRYADYFQQTQHADALTVGDKRYMVTVAFRPPFATSLLYAHPLVLPIIKAILGEDCVLGSFASVASLPGAALQHRHRDGPSLFPTMPNELLPCYALTMAIPLIEFNDLHGTTRLWPGTHLQMAAEPASTPFVDPHVSLGSCFLMDYRILHQGTENRSQHVRPLLYLVYHRPWFKDYLNYRKQPFLIISRKEYQKIPDCYRGLFAWIEHYKHGLF